MALLEENLKGQTEVLDQLHALQASEFVSHHFGRARSRVHGSDLEGVVTHIHPRFVAITGYRPEDLVGTKGEIMLDEEGLAKMKKWLPSDSKGNLPPTSCLYNIGWGIELAADHRRAHPQPRWRSGGFSGHSF